MKIENAIPPITSELGKYWQQPKAGSILIDDTHAIISQHAFSMLAEYSASLPSGVYNGKMWRAQAGGVDYLRWYGDGGPNQCTINTRILLIA